jgi:hypothetical protein
MDESTLASAAKYASSIAPFYGHDLLRWTRACLTSPYGVLCSRISIVGAKEMILKTGDGIEVGVAPMPDHPLDSSLFTWMLAQARRRGVEMRSVSPLQRLIFEDGEVMGAVFEDCSGPRTVYARRGVVLSTGRGRTDSSPPLPPASSSTNSRLGLVSAVASRFGRLEILTNESAKTREAKRIRLHDDARGVSPAG